MSYKFKMPKYFRGKLIEEWLKEPEKQVVVIPPIVQPSTSSQGDFWRIPNVNYRGNLKNVRLWKQLIPSMNHDALVKYSLDAKLKGEFYAPNSILNFAIFEALYNSRNSNVSESEEARRFIQRSLRDTYSNTLTRIIYNPKPQLDEIIHNYGILNEQFSFNENVVGENREIESDDKNILEKILGTNDINKIKEVFKWINETSTWIWRVNSKPENKDERVVRLYANSDRVALNWNFDDRLYVSDVDWGRVDVGRAFGVFEE